MAICQIMIASHCKRNGYERRFYGKNQAYYSDANLREGIEYAEWLIEEGYEYCPMNYYRLEDFIIWAKEQIVIGKLDKKLLRKHKNE